MTPTSKPRGLTALSSAWRSDLVLKSDDTDNGSVGYWNLLRIAELPHCRSPKFPSCGAGGELGLRLAHGVVSSCSAGVVALLGAGAGDAEEVADFGP